MRIYYSLLVLMLCSTTLSGQWNGYNYRLPINNVEDQWHRIDLPLALFAHSQDNLSDVRIYGLTASSDTLEIPYILQEAIDVIVEKEVPFSIINESFNESGFYFTFQLDELQDINQMQLTFQENNFDWLVQLQASHDQQQWYTLLEDYRILSIKNEWTDYKFNQLSFPNAQYKFYRLRIPSEEAPGLLKAAVYHRQLKAGSYLNFPIKDYQQSHLIKEKVTHVDFELNDVTPVSRLSLQIMDQVDFYRSFTLQYVVDSAETDHGWQRQYKTLTRGTLNSLEQQRYLFDKVVARQFRIVINNQDNQPLHLGRIELSGAKHFLTARFRQADLYYLVFGNEESRVPQYDIVRFQSTIPQQISSLELGSLEQLNPEGMTKKQLFTNKIWLWAIMIAIIGLLGWSSVRMLRS